jgi:hypothetical protein
MSDSAPLASNVIAAIDAAIDAAGGVTKLAKQVRRHHSSILGWRKTGRVPAEHVAAMSLISGLPKSAFRPDLWPAEAAA